MAVSSVFVIILMIIGFCHCATDKIDQLVDELQSSTDGNCNQMKCSYEQLAKSIQLSTIKEAHKEYAILDTKTLLMKARTSPLVAATLDVILGAWETSQPKEDEENVLRKFVLRRFAKLYPIYASPRNENYMFLMPDMEQFDNIKPHERRLVKIIMLFNTFMRHFMLDNEGYTANDLKLLRSAKQQYKLFLTRWRNYHDYFGEEPLSSLNKVDFLDMLSVFDHKAWQILADYVFEQPLPDELKEPEAIMQYYGDTILRNHNHRKYERMVKRREKRKINNNRT